MITISTIKGFIEHAPQDPGPIADGLLGWWATVEGGEAFVCARCVGRIQARGCSLGRSSPVWEDKDEPIGVCVCCN